MSQNIRVDPTGTSSMSYLKPMCLTDGHSGCDIFGSIVDRATRSCFLDAHKTFQILV